MVGPVRTYPGAATASASAIRLALSEFPAVVGSPSYAMVASRMNAWLLGDSADEFFGGMFKLPDSWSTIDIDLLVVNATADAGTVTFRWDHREFDPASESINVAPATGSNVDWVADSQYVSNRVAVDTGVAVTTGDVQHFRAGRLGLSGGNDDKIGDAAVYAIEITRAS